MSDYGLNKVDAVCICHVIILEVKFKRNINHHYFNILFELPNEISLIGSYLLPSFILVTLGKIVIIKKVYSENFHYKLITNLFKA